MTRTAQVTQAVSARQKARASDSAVSAPAPMTFRVYADNGGSYHWTIVAGGGDILVRSGDFGSYEQAEQAAGIVQRDVSRASFEHRSSARSVELPARGEGVTARDRLDAERWLDEGGSFSSEAVTR